MSEPLRVTCQRDSLSLTGSDLMVTEPLKIGVPDDIGIAFEDSDELFRVDFQQRTFGMDQAMIEPKVASQAVPNRQPNISPPLLV